MGVAEARRRCPGLVLVSGEDLTPYRQASKALLAVLRRYGPAEKLGLDEVFVDASQQARQRCAAGTAPPAWRGHLHRAGTELVQESRHRVMDLRVVVAGGGVPSSSSAAALQAGQGTAGGPAGPRPAWEALLRAGSAIAAEARAAVKVRAGLLLTFSLRPILKIATHNLQHAWSFPTINECRRQAETGFVCSAGVASNKLLAKLCSGLHKPDDQTILLPPEAAAFVAPLAVRALPGVGHKLEGELAAIGVATAAQLRPFPRPELVRRFGERTGAFLHGACRGKVRVGAAPLGEIDSGHGICTCC